MIDSADSWRLFTLCALWIYVVFMVELLLFQITIHIVIILAVECGIARKCTQVASRHGTMLEITELPE